MTNEEKSAVRQLRLAGINYTQIAEKLGLPEGTVKSFCSRNQLRTADIGKMDSVSQFCKQCGKPLHYRLKKKPKQFCSDHCRLKWWNEHRGEVNKKGATKQACHACGKKFETYSTDRKYCCHACYISDRFGKAGT